MHHRLARNALGLAMALALVACSSNPKAPMTIGTAHFQHTHTVLPTGRHQLVVTATPGGGQSETEAVQLAQNFADEFASRTCPKGYSYYADGPLSQKTKGMTAQQTFVFACK
jgi:hypothetical protein